MSTTHADKLISTWFKQKYFIDGEFIKPLPNQKPQRYNPLDLYKPSTPNQRVTDSLHHIFASLDITDELEIEKFYTKYGPLGLFEKDIIKVVAFPPVFKHIYPMPEDSPVAGVERDSNELIPLNDLMYRYNISKDKFHWMKPGRLWSGVSSDPYYIDQDNLTETDGVTIPIIEISALDTWERIQDFRRESERFRRTINLRSALVDRDIDQIRNILSRNSHQSASNNVSNMTEKELLITASGLIFWEVNGSMENRVTPLLTFNDSGFEISKNISWRCDSLLTALYVMLFLDITRGALSRRCKKCNRFFESMRPNTEYCSTSCQTSAKSKKSKDKKKKQQGTGMED